MSSTAQQSPSNRRPRVRKSIASFPSSEHDATASDKENAQPTRSISDDMIFTFGQAAHDKASKKSRSKSLGPGGLDALREGSGNGRKSVSALPKSILKPTIPLSPLKEIPSRRPDAAAKSYASPTRASAQKDVRNRPNSPTKQDHQSPIKAQQPSTRDLSPEHTFTLLRPMETDEEATKRRAEKERIVKQREERRKSMANRRVSFAPEATLHMWDVVEYMQDSTTSSASTDSTRRASSMSQVQEAPSQSPSTPSHSRPEMQVEGTPEEEHRRKRRRSSAVPPVNFNDFDAPSSSPFVGEPLQQDGSDDDDSRGADLANNSNNDDGDASMDFTAAHFQYPKLPAGDENIDVALREAAVNGGTKEMEHDDNGDVSMEIDGDDPSAAFKPWIQQSKGASSPHPRGKSVAAGDQENIDPFLPTIAKPTGFVVASGEESDNDDDVSMDMSMDMTKAMGRILPQNAQSAESRRKSIAQRRQSTAQSEAGDSTMAMDFTTALGGIKAASSANDSTSVIDENEEMSMEFTSVFGGGLMKAGNQERHESSVEELNETRSVDGDGDMEMTTALGSILPRAHNQSHANTHSPEAVAQLPSRRRSSATRRHSSTSATGSPAPAAQRSVNDVNASPERSTTSSPGRIPSTPSRHSTPRAQKPQAPNKTPPFASGARRNPSPTKSSAKGPSAKSPFTTGSKVFNENGDSRHTPNVVLAPHSHLQRATTEASSALSPRIAELFDRRTSIGDRAGNFAVQSLDSKGVRFEDPKTMDEEVTREREEDARRESSQFVLEQEADNELDQENATQILRDLMDSMTPKKKPSKVAGRKSLHVGAARGLLGKRPAELDDDDQRSPEGIKGREGSPIKRIRLQAPPSISETTGRPSRKSLVALSGNDNSHTPSTDSPSINKSATTPRGQGRFKDAERLPSAQKSIQVFGEQNVEESGDGSAMQEENIKLQEFLNMTGVRFMELNTTKRRHTQGPTKGRNSGIDAFQKKPPQEQLEESVVAGACTIPMLELFQHSCRELKKYISEGRDIVKEIEADTFEENPPMFREYMSASPATRAKMDNQFKNMKAHARHLSKGMWYEWRMKLLDGLKHGLQGTVADMKDDFTLIEKLEKHLDKHLPDLTAQKQQLEQEQTQLQLRASDFKASDPQALSETRDRLRALTEELSAKRSLLEERQRAVKQSSAAIEVAQQTKSEYQKSIKQAHRQREAFRGWSSQEVKKLRSRISDIEKSTGWSIVSASGTTLTLNYRQEIQLYFNIASFERAADEPKRKSTSNSPISLAYVANTESAPLTTEKRFFLQIMRAHLQSLVQAQVTVKDLLSFVSEGWNTSLSVVEEIRRLNMIAPARCSIIADERMSVTTELLLPETVSKINVALQIGVGIVSGRMTARMDNASAKCVYGETFKEGKMKEFVESNLGPVGEGSWRGVVVELRNKLAARGKK